jgi:6-phosphogluconolactonase
MSVINVVKDGSLGSVVIEYILNSARKCISKKESFNLGLSGGSLIEILKNERFWNDSNGTFDRWNVFLVDERCCPIESEDSTYGEYQRKIPGFIKRVNFPIPFIGGSPTEAASRYENILRNYGDGLDLIILGLGPDGHTASLFPPTTNAMLSTNRIVESVHDSPKPPSERITMTIPYLCKCADIVFVATGSSKAKVLRQILIDRVDCLPPSVINKTSHTSWFLDGESASAIQ